eukprot:Selendium_serpulae@DN3096_c0_g1_i3.p1
MELAAPKLARIGPAPFITIQPVEPNQIPQAVIKLDNIDSAGREVAFKIKIKLSTQSWMYVVQPSTGIVKREGSVIVNITAQAKRAGDKVPTGDEFMVQFAPTDSDGRQPTREEWSNSRCREIMPVWWPAIGTKHMELCKYIDELTDKLKALQGHLKSEQTKHHQLQLQLSTTQPLFKTKWHLSQMLIVVVLFTTILILFSQTFFFS